MAEKRLCWPILLFQSTSGSALDLAFQNPKPWQEDYQFQC